MTKSVIRANHTNRERTTIDHNLATAADFAIDFSVTGNGATVTGPGWSTPEPGETWTVGPRAQLVLPAPASPATYVMVLKLRPQVIEGRLPSALN